MAFWKDGGHFNDRRLTEGEKVRAVGSLRKRGAIMESDLG